MLVSAVASACMPGFLSLPNYNNAHPTTNHIREQAKWLGRRRCCSNTTERCHTELDWSLCQLHHCRRCTCHALPSPIQRERNRRNRPKPAGWPMPCDIASSTASELVMAGLRYVVALIVYPVLSLVIVPVTSLWPDGSCWFRTVNPVPVGGG